MKRILVVLAFAALVSGCLCCGGLDLNLLGGKPPAESNEAECTAPYIRVGAECCLDDDGNGICDTDEETGTTAEETATTIEEEASTTLPPATTEPTQTIQSTMPPTTTVATGASCGDGVQNQGEEYVDCGGPCANCVVLTLGGWREFKNTGYKFRYDGKEGTGQELKYWVEIRTPDGITDRRPLSTGESFVDYLRFKVINYGEDPPKAYIKLNAEDLSAVPQDATLMTFGGQSCAQLGGGMCERTFGGYKIKMLNREENGANLIITLPGGAELRNVKVLEDKVTITPDAGLQIGGFFDSSHFIQGGYNLFYLREV